MGDHGPGVAVEPTLPPRALIAGPRPAARGKFIFRGHEKLSVRGVTYGTFRPQHEEIQFPERSVVAGDFAQMAAQGINAIRTYTVPPGWLLDLGQEHGLSVLVGLPWEEHLAFLDDRKLPGGITARVRAGVRACAGHPAVLGYAVGNEIPSSVVRWHGRGRIERFLRRLHETVKQEDPEGLVTYVNYPTTEYLQLPFVDLVCFNLYLESRKPFAAYLARLQNLAGERPLLLTECGLDSRRHGEEAQAETLDWQVRTAFSAGCAGIFVYAWTDEWCRGGYDIQDWDFGLTRRDRRPKPALDAVRRAFSEVPFPASLPWPSISVLVCTYNGGHVIEHCFQALLKLEYPNYEVIVVSDGSTDGTVALAQAYGFRVIAQENQGLAAARNRALEAATGQIVAYIDDDAYPDPHWLTYLAHGFLTTRHAGMGGPNVAPEGDGMVADCVTDAPGGPNVVLLSDTEAEHIPGCNMAFRKECLEAVGGFDPQFRIAGDDVDLCWRLQERGWTLGYSPAAMVWHRRRNSVQAYWRQQWNYGRAEALLERRWPEKYTPLGHLTWAGRIYGKGHTIGLHSLRERVYHGLWGSAPFQSVYRPPPSLLESLLLVPEWYLVNAALAALAALGFLWRPLLLALPVLGLSVGLVLVQACLSAARAELKTNLGSRPSRWKPRMLVAFLHLLQPAARLWGRLGYGLAPWRLRATSGFVFPRARSVSFRSGRWKTDGERLAALRASLVSRAVQVASGAETERWDLQVRGGLLGDARILMAIEEHGAGIQRVLVRLWPRVSPLAWTLTTVFAALGSAARSQSWAACTLLGATALLVAGRTFLECSAATAAALWAIGRARAEET